MLKNTDAAEAWVDYWRKKSGKRFNFQSLNATHGFKGKDLYDYNQQQYKKLGRLL